MIKIRCLLPPVVNPGEGVLLGKVGDIAEVEDSHFWQGMIARNAVEVVVDEPKTGDVDLSGLSKRELLAFAEEAGIEADSRLKVDDLREFIEKALNPVEIPAEESGEEIEDGDKTDEADEADPAEESGEETK